MAPQPSDFDVDLALRPLDDTRPAPPRWDGTFDRGHGPEPPRVPPRSQAERKLPLFSRVPDDAGDEPLVRLPAAPRPPLAVRRTPEAPRLRAVPRRPKPVEVEPALQFVEDAPVGVPAESAADVRARTAARLAAQSSQAGTSGPGPRAAAAAIDHLLLCAIDATVIYFTLRMTGLPMAGLTELPLAPLVAFLMLVKLSYFCAFTAVGGQTIGKMALRIRVVTAENAPLDAGSAALRALAGTLSAALLGLGYIPALFGSERRALHDRLMRTRVVALPPA